MATIAGRSLGGGLALTAEAVLAAVWFGAGGDGGGVHARRWQGWRGWQGWRHWRQGRSWRAWRVAAGLLLLAAALAAGQLARMRRIGSGRDPSAAARAVYLRAGWEGWRERPWLGWGPGSAAWTAAWFLVPRPGLNPWGEAVGELHSLPVELAYETGALGLAAAAAVAALFVARRWRERHAACDPDLLAAGCLGLAGGGVAWLSTAALGGGGFADGDGGGGGAALAGGVAAGSAVADRQRQTAAGGAAGAVADPPERVGRASAAGRSATAGAGGVPSLARIAYGLLAATAPAGAGDGGGRHP